MPKRLALIHNGPCGRSPNAITNKVKMRRGAIRCSRILVVALRLFSVVLPSRKRLLLHTRTIEKAHQNFPSIREFNRMVMAIGEVSSLARAPARMLGNLLRR